MSSFLADWECLAMALNTTSSRGWPRGFKKAYEDVEISLHLMAVNIILAYALGPF